MLRILSSGGWQAGHYAPYVKYVLFPVESLARCRDFILVKIQPGVLQFSSGPNHPELAQTPQVRGHGPLPSDTSSTLGVPRPSALLINGL